MSSLESRTPLHFGAPRVIISAGHGNLFFLSTASAVSKAGSLVGYITTIYARPWQRRLLNSKAVTSLIGKRTARKLVGHHRPQLDVTRITVLTSVELTARLLKVGHRVLSRPMRGYADFAFSFPMVLYGRLSASRIFDCDIFHVRSGYGRFAMERARHRGAICLVDHSIADSNFLFAVYEEESRKWSAGKVANPLTQAAFKAINQDLADADHIVVNSDFVKSTLMEAKRARGEQISVVYLGVDTAMFKPASSDAKSDAQKPFTILFVGTIDYRKGALYLLEAVKRLRLANCRLILLGPVGNVPIGRYDGQFEHIASVAFSDLPAWYTQASVFVFPSLAEGSARVNFEAMASGLPVITTKEAGSPIRDGVDGFIVPARDVDALADRIDQLHRKPERGYEIGSAARERIEAHFTWERYSESLLAIYERLLLDRHTSATELRRPGVAP